MTNENDKATTSSSATPTSDKDAQDQVFGQKAEERKKAAETGSHDPASAGDRPTEPRAAGKA